MSQLPRRRKKSAIRVVRWYTSGRAKCFVCSSLRWREPPAPQAGKCSKAVVPFQSVELTVAEVETCFTMAAIIGDDGEPVNIFTSWAKAVCLILMNDSGMAFIFVFLDGVGLAPSAPTNPLAHVPMPALHRLLGGPLTSEHIGYRDELLLAPLDACLGVEGLPQSGTNHVALLAGVNAPALHGRHQPHFPPVALRPLLAERSLFRRAQMQGQRVAFANVFTAGYWQALAERRLRRSASVIAAEGAGLYLRTLDDLRAGNALSWDITGEGLAARDPAAATIAPISPLAAGERLARLASDYDLVFFESFLPDLAGHGRLGPDGAATALTRIDGLLAGWLRARRPSDSLLITSDHGNIEQAATTTHTTAPAPLLVIGPHAGYFRHVRRIDEVADAILAALAHT